MRSDLPKVLHHLAGQPLLSHVISRRRRAWGRERVHVVYGHGGGAVREALSAAPTSNGWNSASSSAPAMRSYRRCPGFPTRRPCWCSTATSRWSIELRCTRPRRWPRTVASRSSPRWWTTRVGTVASCGARTVRSSASSKSGTRPRSSAASPRSTPGSWPRAPGGCADWLPRLGRDNAQGEYYLTDVIALAVEDGLAVRTVPPEAVEEVLGVNDRIQLAALERFHQGRPGQGTHARRRERRRSGRSRHPRPRAYRPRRLHRRQCSVRGRGRPRRSGEHRPRLR